MHIHWKINKGDLVKISSSDGPSQYSYGVVVSKEPFEDQLALFPAVMVFSFLHGCARQYYPYNLEIISQVA
jgi:hypothetical protein